MIFFSKNCLYILIFFLITVSCINTFAGKRFSKGAQKNENLDLPYANRYYSQETSYDSKIDEEEMERISQGPLRKLGRGISNILFGVFEIFIQPYEINEKEGGISACTYGLVRGVFYFLAREGVGIVDFLTFPFPLPGAAPSGYKDEWGYGPLMEPAWIFDLERNPYNFVYHDNPL
ncbi:MAG: exosortase system-associated protein, TIGR04073 family [Victivallales bacterium]|nr:exosortase system-associated protein, TIGR04073 family [Victivallales bacterium]MCF7888959.1 exosortase system-associated protein, TIGR04073 family [Victivallales bacterium]